MGYVEFAFAWGQGELSASKGPRKWQKEFLYRLGKELKSGASRSEAIDKAIQMAAASGHGVGKSCLVAWVILWAMSTLVDTRGVVTANTAGQLASKTWPELSVWHRRAINQHWFAFTATAFYSVDKKHEKTWRFDCVPWSEHKTEAFAGLHNKGKRIVLIMDEASAIPDKIWEVSEGALTDEDTEIIWCVFGNPTRNVGRFRDCFGRLKHRWITWQIDSRTVEGTNKAQFEAWIEDYGEDSDFVRVRVRGRFPRASSMQFFPSDLIARSMKIESRCNLGDPQIMTLDIARGGDDECVITFRRGLDGRWKPMRTIPGSEVRDSMRLVSIVVDELNRNKPDAFFFDGVGVGGPVGDRVKQLGYNVMEVTASLPSPDPKYANMRAYMYIKMREWMEAGGALPDDPVLEAQLTSIEFTHNKRDQLILISKEQMKKDGIESPDRADSYALGFAHPVAPVKGLGAAGETSRFADWTPSFT